MAALVSLAFFGVPSPKPFFPACPTGRLLWRRRQRRATAATIAHHAIAATAETISATEHAASAKGGAAAAAGGGAHQRERTGSMEELLGAEDVTVRVCEPRTWR